MGEHSRLLCVFGAATEEFNLIDCFQKPDCNPHTTYPPPRLLVHQLIYKKSIQPYTMGRILYVCRIVNDKN